ncbi:MAG: hypothetical protein J6A83_08630 [Clostridia bacterium]|nr:hypothetical protein [Clostridia bacterium]
MRSKSIFTKAAIALSIVLILVMITLTVVICSGSEEVAHVSLISGSGLDRIEVVDKDGESLWTLPKAKIGWVEVNDADMLPNGNIVFACRADTHSTVYMVKPDYANKTGYEELWTYEIPGGGENHTSQVLPDGGVLVCEAYKTHVRIVELDIQGNVRKVIDDLEDWSSGGNSHSQVRQIYKTEEGTYLLASMNVAKTMEYSSSGEKIAEYPAGGFTAIRKDNGDTIVAGGDSHTITCFSASDGSEIWKIEQNDIEGVSLGFVAAINVLENGNIVFANWGGHGGASGDSVIEISNPETDPEIVWSMNIGSAVSNVAILDDIDSSVFKGGDEEKTFTPAKTANYRSPLDAVGTMLTNRLYVVDETNNTVEVINTVNNALINEFQVSQNPNTLILSPDAKYLYVATGMSCGKVEAINTVTGLSAGEVSVGHTPSALAISEDGMTLYIANRFNGTVQTVPLTNGEIAEGTVASEGLYVTREPMSIALREGKLYVGGHLPTGSMDDESISCEVVVVDANKMAVKKTITMVSGSTNLKDIALSPDGEYLYVTHAIGRWNVSTTHVDRGWIYTNAITEIRTSDDTVRATMLVDDLDLGAANPWGIDVSADKIVLSIAGTQEMMIIDRNALREKIEKVYSGDIGGNIYLETPEDIANDLTFTTHLKQRIDLGQDGPRGIEIVGNKVYTANYYSGSISVYDMSEESLNKLSLTTALEEDETRGGERLWNDATICFGQWQSCASCHPDGRVDALNWDNMNDGMGTPKQARSMVGSWYRGRVMATGIRPNTMAANRAGLKYICFNAGLPESEMIEIDAYTKNIQAEESPYLVDGKLSESALRGQELFYGKANCASCHSGELYGKDTLIYENFVQSETETRGLLVPPLVESWRTAPYLHDGSAATILDVLTTRNLTGTHGDVADLTNEELEDLCCFVLSIGTNSEILDSNDNDSSEIQDNDSEPKPYEGSSLTKVLLISGGALSAVAAVATGTVIIIRKKKKNIKTK